MYSLTLLTTTPVPRNLLNRSLLWCGLLLSSIAWFAFSPLTQAVTPAPDGGYVNENTAEGENALNSLNTTPDFGPHGNTAIGYQTLSVETVAGGRNTAIGDAALVFNTADDNTAVGAFALNNNSSGTRNTATGGEALDSNTTGSQNTATGYQALGFNKTGIQNTATGSGALQKNAADNNTATGFEALFQNTTGTFNTATGVLALGRNTTGNNNTATGLDALQFNNADDNTATGFLALASNTTGTQNTAIGASALQNNTIAGNNTATGFNALYNNNPNSGSGGFSNTANGAFALFSNQSGTGDTAMGAGSLYSNLASNNTATGSNALYHNTNGTANTANGVAALVGNTLGIDNTANGGFALQKNTTGNNNTALGWLAGQNLTTGSNNIDIGANVSGPAGEADTIRIGKQGTQAATLIAGIFSKGVASATGVNVKIDSTGKLGTVLSSARYKEAIKPMDNASESILRLEPITFRYKKEFDPDGVTQFGLVAEDVEKVCPDLVVYDEEGKPMTVRYDAVNAMLLNEFLKEHGKVQELEEKVAALTAGLQKITAELETRDRASGVVISQK